MALAGTLPSYMYELTILSPVNNVRTIIYNYFFICLFLNIGTVVYNENVDLACLSTRPLIQQHLQWGRATRFFHVSPSCIVLKGNNYIMTDKYNLLYQINANRKFTRILKYRIYFLRVNFLP